jgi:flagellar motility protein MotE (MotC chaperone)
MRLPQLRALPIFCAVGGLAIVVKLGGAIVAAGNLGIATAQAASPAPAAQAAPLAAAAPPAPAAAAEAKAERPAPPPAVDPDTLQALAQRRAELDKRAEEIRDREATIAAAQKRLDEKLAEARALEGKITAAAKERDQEEGARIKSLVKIYETMKPKDAARVFEQLEMPVLLKVVEGMKEAKTAPILAAMDPQKAKAVTVALVGKDDPKAPAAKPARPGKL